MIGKFLPPSTQRMRSTQQFSLRISVLALCFLCVLGGNSSAQEFKSIHPGVEYVLVEHKIGTDPVKINLLRLDLKKVRLDVHHAFEKAIGVEPTSEIGKRNNAIAAINAGFFRKDETPFSGDAAGALIIDGRVLSESVNSRATLMIENGKKGTITMFGNFDTKSFLSFGNDRRAALTISGFNRERKPGEAVLYDAALAKTLEDKSRTIEILLGHCSDPKLGSRSEFSQISCREVEINRTMSRPSMSATTDYILSMDDEYVRANSQTELLAKLESLPKQKRKVSILTRLRDGGSIFLFDDGTDMTNGVSQLIKNGVISITWEQEKASKSFAETRHPRTAVAKLKDGKFLMITVDGRQPGVSVGMNLQELAEYLLSIGATDAMNLDGGGSTTMFLDGKVVNTPSDKEGERKVSDAIVVTLRKNARR